MKETTISPILLAVEPPMQKETFVEPILFYSLILTEYGLDCRKYERYLQVGQIAWIQGWILDISVVKHQIPALLQAILPMLIEEKVPFTLVRNSELAASVLTDEYGYPSLGKIMSIYPHGDEHACHLALQLLGLTTSFKGPDIPTDFRLGTVVYTRYGAGIGIVRVNENHLEEKFIYDSKGHLVKESFAIPFTVPDGIAWPFGQITQPVAPRKESVLQDRYWPMDTLKDDCKGYVKRGLWLEKIYRIRWCVIKEGKFAMIADCWDRTIEDRIRWQFELHKNLENTIPVPKVYNLFSVDDATYMTMEFIRGASLASVIRQNLSSNRWSGHSPDTKLKVLNFAFQLLDMIEALHQKGYIHRDITPNNFLVVKGMKLYMIDLELAYSQLEHKPYPPFQWGTPGFMSPEQENKEIPTIQQDIYSLGATFLTLMTGLMPYAFTTADQYTLTQQLYFFLEDQLLVQIIVGCMSPDHTSRPTVPNIRSALIKVQETISAQSVSQQHFLSILPVDKELIKDIITSALDTLAKPVFLNSDNLWTSRTEEMTAMAVNRAIQATVSPGYANGLSGILYVLAQARFAGFSFDTCLPAIKKSFEFIREKVALHVKDNPGGLFNGTAGMALALVEALNSSLPFPVGSHQADIAAWLENDNINICELSMANGLAGQGIAILRCLEISNVPLLPRLKSIIDKLLTQQQKDGSWLTDSGGRKRHSATGYGHGVAGITIFLLQYLKTFPDSAVNSAVLRSLHWLLKQSHKTNGTLTWYVDNKRRQIDTSALDGMPSVILCFLKAFTILKDTLYRRTAEIALSGLPFNSITLDLTLASGITGLGQLYLEAAHSFQSEIWYQRATWIGHYLLHYYRRKDNTLFWSTDGTPFASVGLMNGHCGVVQFLLRLYDPGHAKHPFLIN